MSRLTLPITILVFLTATHLRAEDRSLEFFEVELELFPCQMTPYLIYEFQAVALQGFLVIFNDNFWKIKKQLP